MRPLWGIRKSTKQNSMNIENQVMFIPFVTGPIFMLFGLVLLKLPPKKINWLYGYRTPRAMKSQERWDFAQRYAAKEMIKLGSFLLLTASAGLIYKPEANISNIVGLGLVIMVIVTLIVRVENAIKNRFDKLKREQ
jgi:uncharacterized membrane protein